MIAWLMVHGMSLDAKKPKIKKITLDYKWTTINLCRSGVSPRIFLKGVPEGTVKLRVRVKDLHVPDYNHGGGTIKYYGSGEIAQGALLNYRGPCPPIGRPHRYVIYITALNSSGKTIGTGKKIVPCRRPLMKK